MIVLMKVGSIAMLMNREYIMTLMLEMLEEYSEEKKLLIYV
jgi:hypothetical protein